MTAATPNLSALAAELIRSRRTIHDFKPGLLPPREIILKALDLARWGPNHHLTEPWRFYLLGRETATAVAQLNADLVAAQQGAQAAQKKHARWLAMPGWLVVTRANSQDPTRAREDYAACCCAIQNFMLYLWSEGIGVKWGTGAVTQDPQFYDLIWVNPDLETVVGLFWYGYALEVPEQQRKPLDSVLVELP